MRGKAVDWAGLVRVFKYQGLKQFEADKGANTRNSISASFIFH